MEIVGPHLPEMLDWLMADKLLHVSLLPCSGA